MIMVYILQAAKTAGIIFFLPMGGAVDTWFMLPFPLFNVMLIKDSESQ